MWWQKLLLGFLCLSGFVLWRVHGTLRWGTGESIGWFAAQKCDQMGLSEETRKSVLTKIASFSARVQGGEIGISAALRLMNEFDHGPLYAAILTAGFRDSFLKSDGSAEREADRVILNRFFAGVKTGALDSQWLDRLGQAVLEETDFSQRTRGGLILSEKALVMKRALDEKIIRGCFQFMATTNEKAGGVLPAVDIDPAVELEAAIHRIQSE